MQSNRKVIVLGSNYGGKPDKNILAMTRYLSSHKELQLVVSTHDKNRHYWPLDIIEKCSVVSRSGLKALMYVLKAHTILYTHSLSDTFPYAHRIPGFSLVCRGIKIFLQHGVIGLKKNLANGKTLGHYLSTLQPTFDYMVVSSLHEAELVASLGINRNKIKVTGLPRFDMYNMIPKASKDDQKILIFLTWQAQEKGLEKLSFLMKSIELYDPALKYDVINHPMVSTDSSSDISISNYSLLITDDSSLAWDFFYTQRNVIFFRPEEWLTDNDKINSLIANDASSLSMLLTKHFNNTVPMLKPSEVADHVDSDNCARVAKLMQLSN